MLTPTMMTLGEACDIYGDCRLPKGTGIRIAGGRKVYAEMGRVWRERGRDFCFLTAKPYEGYPSPYSWEKARRFLPDNTLVELVPLPTETPDNA